MIGESVGRYEVVEELGHGGMSVVYRGVDAQLERDVAIKVLHDHLAKKPENRKRLHREAKAIARLRHPNILEIYDYAAEDAQRSFIVMEFVRGVTLRQFIDEHGPMPPEHTAALGIQLCRALGMAHSEGIIHRDLKPENVMVSQTGEVKLMDFGIAHVLDAETMTQTGNILGSAGHMAPELIEGEKIGPKADIFALGTVLYWLSTGHLPFEGRSAPQILKRVLEGIYKNPENVEPKVGQDFGDVIRTCMAYVQDERYADLDTLTGDLECYLAARGITDPDAALVAYLADPAGVRDTFEDEVVPRLIELGDDRRRTIGIPEACRVYNRVLAYDPQNEVVRTRLDQMMRDRPSPMIIGAAAAGMLAIAGLGYLGVTSLDPPTDESSELVATSETPTSPGEDMADEGLSHDEAQARAQRLAEDMDPVALDMANTLAGVAGVAELGAVIARNTLETSTRVAQSTADADSRRFSSALNLTRGASADMDVVPAVAIVEPDMGAGSTIEPPPEPEPTFAYKFNVRPQNARLEIDGQTVASRGFYFLPSLKNGIHEYTVTKDGFKTVKNNFVVNGAQKNPENIVMEYEPARLSVSANHAALIQIEDLTTWKELDPSQSTNLDVEMGECCDADGERTVTVIIKRNPFFADNPKHRQVKKVPIKAGRTTAISFSFPSGR